MEPAHVPEVSSDEDEWQAFDPLEGTAYSIDPDQYCPGLRQVLLLPQVCVIIYCHTSLQVTSSS